MMSDDHFHSLAPRFLSALRAAEARTLPDLERAVAAALQSVTAQDAEGWFHSCGYTQK